MALALLIRAILLCMTKLIGVTFKMSLLRHRHMHSEAFGRGPPDVQVHSQQPPDSCSAASFSLSLLLVVFFLHAGVFCTPPCAFACFLLPPAVSLDVLVLLGPGYGGMLILNGDRRSWRQPNALVPSAPEDWTSAPHQNLLGLSLEMRGGGHNTHNTDVTNSRDLT